MYEIGPFRLDPAAEVLTHDGVPTPLGSRAVAVLAALVRRRNEHVAKSSIIDAAWPGLMVEESNLAVQISAIRRVLSLAPGGERWVETLARRGYRFVGPVSELQDPNVALRTNLPRALNAFVGRERELAEIKGLLPTTRLLTLVGVGGIGKTRLAQQVMAEALDAYRDGAWFVDLAPLSQSELAASAVAQALGVRAAAGKPLVDALLAHVADRQMLLLLDNCEHVLDSCARLAESLLRGKGELTIIATSREPMQLAAEQAYPLSTLSLPAPDSGLDAVAGSEAVQLFVDRARRHLPRFALTPALASEVARLCINLDGIPLALELAAARVPSLSIEQINDRLHDRFKLLRAGERAGLARHQTLRATMDWSHELLTEDKRQVLRRCAIFAGGFTLEAATHVAAIGDIDEAEVLELLSQLVARSLVIADTDGARARYRMLETTRAYALEKLAEAGETKEVKRRHALFFAEFTDRAPDAWMRMSDAEWHDIYLPELDNVRAALDWALGPGSDGPAAALIACGSCPMWTTLGLWGEGLRRVEAVREDLGSDSEIPEGLRARLWLSLGILQDGAPDQALESFGAAQALFQRTGDTLGLGDAKLRQARVLTMFGRYPEAAACLEEALPAIRGASLPKALGFYYSNSGLLKVQIGDFAGARSDYNTALSLYRQVGAEIASLVTIGALADMTWALGDLEEAAAAFSENVSMLAASTMSRKRSLGWAYCNLSGVLTEMGRLEEALEAARRGLPLLRNGDYLWMMVDHFGLRAALAGNIEAAARLAGYSDAALAAKKATRQFNEARARARLRSLLEERLATGSLVRLLAEGAKLDEEEAGQLALRD